jgi:CTP synthase
LEVINITTLLKNNKKRWENMTKSVEIALVGKYTSQQDTYTSIVKSLEHAGLESNRRVLIKVNFERQ